MLDNFDFVLKMEEQKFHTSPPLKNVLKSFEVSGKLAHISPGEYDIKFITYSSIKAQVMVEFNEFLEIEA